MAAALLSHASGGAVDPPLWMPELMVAAVEVFGGEGKGFKCYSRSYKPPGQQAEASL